MGRYFGLVVVGLSVVGGWSTSTLASEVRGTYLEARTCQVYTGPCFANSEVGLTGKNAFMAWSIDTGEHAGVDLSGLKVTVVVRASDTLAFAGLDDARKLKSIIYLDENASPQQREALTDFAKSHSGKAGRNVVRVLVAPIKMKLDTVYLTGELEVGKLVRFKARKARPEDCICSNESAYYPPLAELTGFVPGVTIDGEVTARPLGSRWSIPDSRTAYLGTFAYK